jgi:hypothetical protein
MYKFVVRQPIAMSEEDLVDHLVYSGASSYSWWHAITVTDTGELLLSADDPRDYDGEEPAVTVSKLIPLSEVAEEIQMILDNPKTPEVVTRAFVEEDIDSDVADWLLQTILFGETIYG